MTVFNASQGNGKGCIAFVPTDSELIGSITEDSFQLLSFTYHGSIQVIVAYVSSNANLKAVAESLQSLLESRLNQVIIGDFNFDTKENNPLTRFMTEKNWHQMVEGPTHEAGRTIDHLYASTDFMKCIELNVMFKYYTDHAALQIKFKW